MTQKAPSPENPSATVDDIVSALNDMKALNIEIMDVEKLTDVTDRLVIATGTSRRHVKACASNVRDELKAKGHAIIGTEGEEDADWVLVDLGSVVVHVMLRETREFYDIESLWRDLPRGDQ